MDNKNYYDLLNVRPNASCREIHASYIRLLEEYKTDLNKTEEEDYFLKMAAKMNIAELEKAYAILSDAEKRKAYNDEIHIDITALPTEPASDTSPETAQVPNSSKRCPHRKENAYLHRRQQTISFPLVFFPRTNHTERILVRLSYHFSRTFSFQYNLQFYFILLFRSHPL